MRIASWNINGGFLLDAKKADLDYYVSQLKQLNPDIVCLQESHSHVGFSQAHIIGARLGLPFIHEHSFSESHLQEGMQLTVSIISRKALSERDVHSLRNPGLETDRHSHMHDKGLVSAVVDADAPFTVVCGHLFPFVQFGSNALAPEHEDIRRDIEQYLNGQKPCVACIDCNFDDAHALLPGLDEIVDVLPDEMTQPTDDRPDHVLVSEELDVLDSHIIESESDHFICFVEIRSTS